MSKAKADKSLKEVGSKEQKPAPATDHSAAFQVPAGYSNGGRKHLNPFHAGDWWLNVNYVEYETNVDSDTFAA